MMPSNTLYIISANQCRMLNVLHDGSGLPFDIIGLICEHYFNVVLGLICFLISLCFDLTGFYCGMF